MITYPVTIAGSATYDIAPVSGNFRVQSVSITNNGSGTVYRGHIPRPAFTRVTSIEVGDSFLTLSTEADGLAIMPGLVAEAGANLDSDTVVTAVVGQKVYLSKAAIDSEAGVTTTFTPPAISTTNGHPIAPGETHHFDTGNGGFSLQQGMRLVADATGTTLVISPKYA
jgi:hypothetical protein